MRAARAQSYWSLGFASAGLVVGVVAGLLLAIIATARSILDQARRILALVEEIADATRPIWQLAQTNAVAVELAAGADSIAEHATALAAALGGSSGPRPAAATPGEDGR